MPISTMAVRGKTPTRPAPRLYLAATIPGEADALARTLAGLATDADIAAVLLRDAAADIKSVKAIVPAVQATDAALLIEGDTALAQRLGADGVHITGIAALKPALEIMKPAGIVGAGGLPSRHEAMVAGEAGADYVLFGEPDATGARPSADAVTERVAWWAELFEPPCVAWAGTIEDARNFATAGADFVLVDRLIWDDPRGPRAALMDVAQAIRQHA